MSVAGCSLQPVVEDRPVSAGPSPLPLGKRQFPASQSSAESLTPSTALSGHNELLLLLPRTLRCSWGTKRAPCRNRSGGDPEQALRCRHWQPLGPAPEQQWLFAAACANVPGAQEPNPAACRLQKGPSVTRPAAASKTSSTRAGVTLPHLLGTAIPPAPTPAHRFTGCPAHHVCHCYNH